jgi:hypothetical protein
MVVMQTSTASLVMMGVITVRNCGGADIDRRARVVMMVVIITRNDDDADTDRELGDDGGDHYPQWRWCRHRPRAW